jgi:predicted nucleic acid-binding protein
VTLAAVSDAGPLIHLAEIDSLELLATFDTLLVPETVHTEVDAGGVPDGLADLSYELVEADESRVGTEELDAGEHTAIAVAEERGVVLLTDDLAAREAASDAASKYTVLPASSRSVTAAGCSTEMKPHRVCEHSSVRRVSS